MAAQITGRPTERSVWGIVATSNQLSAALTAVEPLSGEDFSSLKTRVVDGSKSTPAPSGSAITTESGEALLAAPGEALIVENPLSTALVAVSRLGAEDFAAMQSWLTGRGRAALRARGATDSNIGSMRLDVDLMDDAPLG